VLRELPFSFIQFPIYEMLKKRWAEEQGSSITPAQSSLCGSVGGGIAAALTTPFDVIKTRFASMYFTHDILLGCIPLLNLGGGIAAFPLVSRAS